MQFGTTPYPLACPDLRWEPLTRTQEHGSGQLNRNGQLNAAIASFLDDADVELDDDEQEAVDWYLDQL